MIREITKDVFLLKERSIPFNKKVDQGIITDLLDTAKAHHENCAGLAAIQIGFAVKCFVALNPATDKYTVFINPVIVKKSPETYEVEEGCLSLEGLRKVRRHKSITVMYTDINGKIVHENAFGIRAQIIQHECDHLEGKII